MSRDQKGNNKKLLLTTVGDVLMAGVVLVYVTVMPVSASYELPFLFNSDRAIVLMFQFLFCFVSFCFVLLCFALPYFVCSVRRRMPFCTTISLSGSEHFLLK